MISRHFRSPKIFIIILTSLFSLGFFINVLAFYTPSWNKKEQGVELDKLQGKQDIISEYQFQKPIIKRIENYDRVSIEGLENYGDPGLPVLPYKTARILLPKDSQIENIQVDHGEEITLKGQYKIEFGRKPIPLDEKTLPEDKPNLDIYNSSNPFPQDIYTKLSIQELKGYEILLLRLYPVKYVPSLNKVSYFKNITVTIQTIPSQRPIFVRTDNFRNLKEDRDQIFGLVDNPSQVQSYQEITTLDSTQTLPLSICDPADSYEYVIITNGDLSASFQILRDHKISRGITATIVTLDQITSDLDYHGDGIWGDGAEFDDTQARIRNFIKDAYNNWETKYVLLGGDVSVVRYRGFYTSEGVEYIYPNTPADLYYGALDGSFNYNQDDRWGEYGDGVDGGEVDLLAEVYIGRAPVETSEEASNFINKTIAYENTTSTEAYLKKGMFIADYDSTQGSCGVSQHNYSTYKQPIVDNQIPPYISIEPVLYACGGNGPEIMAEMNLGYHLVNHMGHGGSGSVMGISSSNIDAITTNQHFLVNSLGCSTADFYIDNCIGELFVNKNSTGAFAYIGNSRLGWGGNNSKRFDEEFFDAIYQEHIPQLGKAMADMRNDLADSVGHTGSFRMCYMEQTLLGDPETPVFTWNQAPTLDWTGETNFETDGINPDSAVDGSSFEFRVKYTDQENNAPTTAQVWVDIDDDSSYESGEKYDMNAVDSGDTDYTDGKLYTKTLAVDYAGDGTLNYRFYFSDGQYDATGTPASDQTFTVTQAPTLDWTGEANFESDGVNPDSAVSGSSFEFRVKYTDQDNDPPATAQAWIDIDDDGSYQSGEKHDMTGVDSGDTDYTDGKDYTKTLSLDYTGDGTISYRFYFNDGTADATGEPIQDHNVTVLDQTPPTTTNHNPAKNATGISRNTNIYFEMDDTETGVDSSTLKVTIEGKNAILNGSFQTGYTGSITSDGSRGYNVTINPKSDFTYSSRVDITIQARDNSSNTFSERYSFTIINDTVPPAPVSEFKAIPKDGQVLLSWRNPKDPDFVGVRILRKTRTYPKNVNDGKVIYNGKDTSYTDSGLVNGTKYYYTIFSHDAIPNYSSITPFTQAYAVPKDTTPPDPVRDLSAVNYGLNIQLSWHNPENSDFAGVKLIRNTEHYPTNVKDGQLVYQGKGSSYLDESLVGGKEYYYTIFAYDEVLNYSKIILSSRKAIKVPAITITIVTGAGPGGGPHIRSFNINGSPTSISFFAFAKDFHGGVRVATGDVDGNGIDEIIAGAGPGGGPHVRAFDKNGEFLMDFWPFHPAFRGGVDVAAGDVDGDRKDEIAMSQFSQGQCWVKVYKFNKERTILGEWNALGRFEGGCTVTLGDVDKDGEDEVIIGAGTGGGPHVRVFEADGTPKPISFFAFHPNFGTGIDVTAGDVDGDRKDEIGVCQLAQGEAWCKVYRYNNQHTILGEWKAYGSVQCGANISMGDIDYDGKDEIITGAGFGGGPHVRGFEKNSQAISSLNFFGYNENFRGGTDVTTGIF